MRCIYDGVYPCGRCPACLANRQRAFCFRLDQEKEACSFYFWLTLQYSDDYVPWQDGEMCFSKEHCRGFFEKVRKRYEPKGYKFKHFLVSEYGPNGTHRPHYHCLLMVYSDKPLNVLFVERNEMKQFLVTDAWPYGHVTEKSFHGRVLSYLTKYCCKPEVIGQFHKMKPFTLISRGIGLCYLDKISEQKKRQMVEDLDFTVHYGKGKMQLPRYYVDRIAPHSLDDLRNASRDMDFDVYSQIMRLRLGLRRQQRELLDRREAAGEALGQEDSKLRENRISAIWSNFKSKVKSRKEL